MSSILSSQGVVLATAMAAVSGTMILLALRHQKFSHTPRPCLSGSSKFPSFSNIFNTLFSHGKKRKKTKRVRFAEDVVEPSGDGVKFRKQHRKVGTQVSYNTNNCSDGDDESGVERVKKITGMPANRVALYNGMLRDRVGHRLGYSC
ncbi:unnamed protein product [Rhodiola kirilowii]